MTSRRLYLANEYGQEVACMFFFSSLSALCSVVTLATIFDLHKWTAFNILTFCFTFCQLLYDVAWLMYDTRTQYKDDDFVDILYFDSFSLLWGAEFAELLFINVLAFTCFYICWFNKMLDVKKYFKLILFFVASCGITIFVLLYTAERDIWYHEDDDNDTYEETYYYAPPEGNSSTSTNSSSSTLANTITYSVAFLPSWKSLFSASNSSSSSNNSTSAPTLAPTSSSTVHLNGTYVTKSITLIGRHNGAKNAFKKSYIIMRFILVFFILAILIVIQAKLFWNRREKQKIVKSRSNTATKVSSNPVQELVTRLFYYPLVLCICKFPLIWDNIAYTPIFSALNYRPKTDDNITYRASDWLGNILPPSSGIGFAIIFFRMQPLAWRQLKMRALSCLAACFSCVIELEHIIESTLTPSNSTHEPDGDCPSGHIESYTHLADDQLVEIIEKQSKKVRSSPSNSDSDKAATANTGSDGSSINAAGGCTDLYAPESGSEGIEIIKSTDNPLRAMSEPSPPPPPHVVVIEPLSSTLPPSETTNYFSL